MKHRTYQIFLSKEPEGSYTATVPVLPGCVTYGENIEHAISMAKEAVELYIKNLLEKGEDVPDDNHTLVYSLNITTA